MAKFHPHAADNAASFMVVAHPMTPCLRQSSVTGMFNIT